MNSPLVLMALPVFVATCTALLAWLLVDLGSAALMRYRAEFNARARFQMREFFIFVDPRKLFVAHLAAMALGSVAIWVGTGSALLALPTFFALSLIPHATYSMLRRRRLRLFESQLPDALMMLAGSLRAGASLQLAMQQLVAESAPPLEQEFGLILREQRLGVATEKSLENLGRRMPTQTTVLTVSAMRIAGETGGALAETLDRTANTLRSRLQMEGKIDALTSQGRLQAWVVGALPVALMMILQRMEPQAMGELWSTPIGWATLALLAFLECMGIYLIRRIVAIDV